MTVNSILNNIYIKTFNPSGMNAWRWVSITVVNSLLLSVSIYMASGQFGIRQQEIVLIFLVIKLIMFMGGIDLFKLFEKQLRRLKHVW